MKEMTNADKFKNIFGLYATELWSMPEKDFLKWLNSKVVNCSEIPNNSDTISRQQAIDALKEKVFHNLSDEFYGAMQVLDELPSAQPEDWMERNKERILRAGMEGREIEFRIGGRLFAIREKAQ